MICPNCQSEIAVSPVVNDIALCPKCLRSIIPSESRLANANDTSPLNDQQLATLRKARAALRVAH